MIFRKNEYSALDAVIEAAQRFWAEILCNTRVNDHSNNIDTHSYHSTNKPASPNYLMAGQNCGILFGIY